MLPLSRRAGAAAAALLTIMLLLGGGLLPSRLAGAEAASRSFALLAGDAKETLETFSDQAHVPVVYLLEDVRGVTTPALQGDFAIREGLERLLAGTGLVVTKDEKTGTFVIKRERAAAPTNFDPPLDPMKRNTSVSANSSPSKNSKPRSSFLAGVLAVLLGTSGGSNADAAQASAGTSADGTKENEQVVELSPFELSTDSIHGYATSSSTSASRLATPVTELASSLITINEEMISDLAAISPEEILGMVGGMSPLNDSGAQEANTYSMRGYTQTGAQRDGFDDLLFGANGGFSFAFVDRMEVAKGPDGSLNGEMSPGGTLNLVGKRPLARPRTKIGAMFGSFGFYQGDLDTSGLLGKGRKLGYRLSTSYRNTDGPLDSPSDWRKGFFAINPSVRYRFNNGLETWLWTGFIRDGSPRVRPIVKGFRTPDGRGAYLMRLADVSTISVITNRQQVDTDNYEFGATKSFDAGGVHFDVKFIGRYIDQLDSSRRVRQVGVGTATDTYVALDGTILGSDARLIDYSQVENNLYGFFRPTAVAGGAVITTKSTTMGADVGMRFKLGSTRHQMLVSASYNDAEKLTSQGLGGKNYTLSNTTVLASLGVPIVNGVARIWFYPSNLAILNGIDPEKVAELATSVGNQTPTTVNSTREGLGVKERMYFLNDRMILSGGARFTDTKISTRAGTAAAVENRTRDWSTSASLLGKVYKGEKGEVSLFADTNNTFIPVFTLDQRLATFGQKFPNRVAKSKEAGVKFDLLNTRFTTTATVFETVESNALLPEIDVDGSITGTVGRSYSVPSGQRTTKGWDVDFSANLARGLNAVLSTGHNREKMADGTPRAGRAANTWSGLARYEIQSEPLQRLSLLWQYTWWGQSRLNNRTYWVIPPGDLHTAVLGYKWRGYSFKFRVENVFDDRSLRPSVNETAVGIMNHRNYRFALEKVW